MVGQAPKEHIVWFYICIFKYYVYVGCGILKYPKWREIRAALRASWRRAGQCTVGFTQRVVPFNPASNQQSRGRTLDDTPFSIYQCLSCPASVLARKTSLHFNPEDAKSSLRTEQPIIITTTTTTNQQNTSTPPLTWRLVCEASSW